MFGPVSVAIMECALVALTRVPAPASVAAPLPTEPTAAFEENRGQAPPDACFVARAGDHRMLVSADSASFVGEGGASVVRMRLLAASPGAVRGERPLPGTVSYLRGHDPGLWLQGVPTFARVVREQAWPGVDVVFHGVGGSLEHDFVLAPGADPASIGLQFEGGGQPCIEPGGDLVIDEGTGDLRLHRPIAHEVLEDGSTRPVVARFVETAPGIVGFEIAGREPSRQLVIDPVVTFASFLGGSEDETLEGAAAAANGDVAIVGSTTSTDFLAVNAYQDMNRTNRDAFVTRLDPVTQTVRFSTYFGGTDIDEAYGVRFDRFGNLVVVGTTASMDFPLMAAADGTYAGGQDAFVAKLDPEGALVFSTYVGGTDYDVATAVDVDLAGNVFVAGDTSSGDLPVVAARQSATIGLPDGFVARLSPSGPLSWLTYHGGSARDDARGVSAGTDGRTVVVGSTASDDFPLQNAAQSLLGGGTDAYVTVFHADGTALDFSTLLGGGGDDYGNAVARTSGGHSFVVGSTASADFPLAGALRSTFSSGEAFLARYSFNGVRDWSTFIGGFDLDFANDVELDPAENPVVFGNTPSDDLLHVNPTQPLSGGSGDVFVMAVSASGTTNMFSTYAGGPATETIGVGAVDPGGFMTVAGIAYDGGFPTVSPIQASFGSAPPGSGSDGILATFAPGTAADLDGDGAANAVDNCPRLPNAAQVNFEGDPHGDLCDNCVLYANASQADMDFDLRGDACEFLYGDGAPRGAPDGMVNVADAVLGLRFTVGLDVPTEAEMNALDVAPATIFAGPPDFAAPEASFPRSINVADIVLILRVTVGLTFFTEPF